MGIIIREDQTGEIVFYMKGADIVMSSIVQYNDWLEEEVDNMAREGLRTLVVAKKSLTHDQYIDFEQKYNSAKLAVVNRSAQVNTNCSSSICFCIQSEVLFALWTSKTEVLQTPSAIEVNLGQGVK